jgi:hypothetical protein
MSLKFPFKFKHVLTDEVFFADVHEDYVVVSWIDNAGYRQRGYNFSDVNHFIKNNNWVIIEEPSPLVEITQDEYNTLVEEINLLQDLLAGANKRIEELEAQPTGCLPKQFKPISEMTLEDWEQVEKEYAVFLTSQSEEVIIEDVNNGLIFFSKYNLGFSTKGKHVGVPDGYYIVERIR